VQPRRLPQAQTLWLASSSRLYHFLIVAWRAKRQNPSVKRYWEIIADNLGKAGWSWGCVSAVNSNGRTIWIADAHGYGKRFIVRADEMLTAFVELQRAIHEFAVSLIS
jgi:hypothetical protein